MKTLNRLLSPLLLLACLYVFLFFNCINPFFPPHDHPLKVVVNAQTPDQVLGYLVKAYENKRIALYEELIYNSKDFKFYIQVNPNKLVNLNKVNAMRVEYLTHSYIPEDHYIYMDYSEEHRIHQNLFSANNEVKFTQGGLTISSIIYPTLQEHPDTTDAIVRTYEANIRITSDVLLAEYNQRTAEFQVSRQVFHLKRDKTSGWRIYQWYEIDN